MFVWAIVFFALALAAAVLGTTGIAAAAAGMAKIAIVITLVIAVVFAAVTTFLRSRHRD
jgi:uncharacterized membrane protein YtjA (UPF0391 family)